MRWSLHQPPGAPPLALTGMRPAGSLVAVLVDRPTVRVERLLLPEGGEAALKRYFFPRTGARLAAAFRHTWLGPAKVEREARNLLRLAAAGVPVPRPLAWAVARDRAGFVRDGWLLLPWLDPGATLEDLLLAGRAAADPASWAALGAAVGRIHAAGCFYRHLLPRNILAVPGGGWRFLDPASSSWSAPPLEPGYCAADLALLLLPAREALPPGAATAVLGGHGGGLAARPEELPELAPWRLRRRLRHWLAREEDRFKAAARRQRPAGPAPGGPPPRGSGAAS